MVSGSPIWSTSLRRWYCVDRRCIAAHYDANAWRGNRLAVRFSSGPGYAPARCS
jgi:hypothetical protein